MAKRRKERKSRHDIKEMRPAIIIKRLDQRKVTLLAMLFDFDWSSEKKTSFYLSQ